MPQERVARELSEFFKFKHVGQAVVGQVDKFGVAGEYGTQYMILCPVLIRAADDAKPKVYGSVAVGLSADLLSKIDTRRDHMKYLSIIFTGTAPSRKGAPKKVFQVLELSEVEFSAMESRSLNDTAASPYRADVPDILADEDDDLPF